MKPKTCKVFVVGEGQNDIGTLGSLHAPGAVRDGFLQPVIRKLAGGLALEIVGQRIVNLGKLKPKGAKLKGHGPKLFAAIATAASEQAAVVVFVHDADRAGVKPNLRDEYASMVAAEKAAQAELESMPLVVAGLAVCTIEAWAMADVAAWKSLLRRNLPKQKYPKKPEELWGKPGDPGSKHPKQVFTRLKVETGLDASFAELAEACNIQTLAKACPSFERFKCRADFARGCCGATDR